MSLHAHGKRAYEGLLTDGPPMAFSVNSPCTSLYYQKEKKKLGSALLLTHLSHWTFFSFSYRLNSHPLICAYVIVCLYTLQILVVGTYLPAPYPLASTVKSRTHQKGSSLINLW
jgi:hypothetical protein